MCSVIAVAGAGCTTVKTLQATGGSRADGVVELSFEYGMFEKPQVQWAQGAATARDRCRAWGYSSAEPFGGTVSTCQAHDGYGGCVRTLVTAKYQCTGSTASQN
ncbi:MAG: YecR-like lipofamily protein [Xanthomonadaceae bacterium]|nr:YecR-like lipofamily protein [Xanthomonadaceae bacterium]